MPLPPILFEDDTLVAFDKAAGLLVAPDRWDKGRSNLMQLVHDQLGRDIATVHRLDAGTSGVVLCAKTKLALDFLSGQFQSKTAALVCHALVAFLPPEEAMKVVAPVRTVGGALPETFTVELALGEDERDPGRMRVFRGRDGKPAATEFRTLERFGRFAFVECRPLTGRRHQVRLHLTAIGAPVLNDPLYGVPEIELRLSDLKPRYKGRADEQPLIRQLALHASTLTVRHPTTGETLTITAPLPNEFEVALKYLRKFAR
jgi:23S rRNA-/tRNA-specific pseudouridylate synthase